MTFRRRTYPETLDNILTRVVQGVSAETHPFPPADAPPFAHVLEHESVAQVISVYGSRNGQTHRFRPGIDFMVDGKTLIWQHEGGQLPDAGTLISVNYYPSAAQVSLTDIYPGSVLRTLSETVALEIGRLYAQLELVYQSGFIDTATDSALDNVVALLGIERVRGNHPLGEVIFQRAGNSRGVITIPAGTRITTIDGEVEYETTDTITMLAGQNTARVNARDLETTNDPLPADQLTVLPIPIAGIESVTNPNPTSITTQAESDAEVRTRAKNFLVGSERATVGALRHAVERQGVTAEIIEDVTTPGMLRVNTFADALPPELAQRVQTAINNARPAGVFVESPVALVPAKISLEMMIETSDGLLPADLRGIQERVREEISAFFAGLATEENASINKITGLVLGVDGVEDMRLLSASLDGTALDVTGDELALSGQASVLAQLQIADPALPTRLTTTITFPEGSETPDQNSILVDLSTTVAYLNGLNATELPEDASTAELEKRVISYGKLLLATPIPNMTTMPLATFDEAPDPTILPESAEPYTVLFTLTMESGFSQILAAAGDTYTLTPFEQLSLNDVTVTLEENDG